MELYIIRHGQTDWNKAGRLQGMTDTVLNGFGRQAAIDLGNELESDGVEFDAIYSSPLVRAYETACLIRGRRNIAIESDERLREISFGEDEGVSYDDWMKEDCPHRFFFTEPERYAPPEGGETLEELCIRAKNFLQEVVEPLAGTSRRIMIVAHGAMNKGLMAYLEGNDIRHFWGKRLQNNCEADIFTYDGAEWSRGNDS